VKKLNKNINEALVGVVGVCASGKSTLVEGLTARGYTVRHIAQEHSYVKDMWKRITNPDLLIFLDATFMTTLARRNMDWTEKEYSEQQRRLSHARANADFYIDTSQLSPDDVLEKVIFFIINNLLIKTPD
jgi:deoxyadenosine/deoxycytidine kinase